MAIKRPRLKLERKKSYTFDVSNAALATHPFKFTADSGTSEYTTGVTLNGTQGQAGATITFAVDSTAPANMNYYCGTHGLGMGNHIVIVDGGPWYDSENTITLTNTSYKTYVGSGVVYGNTGTGNIFRLEEILPTIVNGGDRAFFAGGRQQSPSQLLSGIQYVEMSTGSNTSSFGSLNQADHWMAGNMSDKTRALFAGGTHQYPTYSNEIKYITCATTGNSSDFGDYTNGSYGMAGLSDGTKALMSGGEGLVAGNYNQNVQYVTIQTTGNSNSFGNLSMYSKRSSAVSDGTYGVFNAIGGYNYEYVTVATLGNASAFGNYYNNLNEAPAAHGNATYGLRMGGENTSYNEISSIEYITIATPGNAAFFGFLATSINENTGTGNATHALSGGGNASGLGAGDQYNNINKVDMSTQGNSTYFGDLMQQQYGAAGNSGNAA